MSMLYLVRHGQASAGTDDYDRLSELGQTQAAMLGDWWSRQGFSPDVSAHGSLVRQRDTARLALHPLASEHSPTEHTGLNEYDHHLVDSTFGFGAKSDDPETLTFDDYLSIMQRWQKGEASEPVHQAEPWLDFYNRGWQSVRELHALASDKKSHAYFTSGGVIASVVSVVLNLDFAHTIDAIWRIRNSSITTLHFDGNRARLVDFNTVPHLQVHHDPSLITLI
ncbi:MAG: broad specificity phosphatase PhoE [Granulosicoccus sp.]|jgi:broad specificity phosphatase PhoE